MSKIKGQTEYLKFRDGKPLTRREAILAHCYACNGEEGGAEDCRGKNCPLYAYFPYRGSGERLQPRKSIVETESGSFMSAQHKEMTDAKELLTIS